MRIVAGSLRGRAIAAGADRRVRPTSDRAREALFNILAHGESFRRAEGPLPRGARVADVFAGTGALGFEALSRGAAHAVFIDDEAEAVRLIQRNAATLGLVERAAILRRDALAPGRPPAGAAPCDLVFLDPPYHSGLAAPALAALARAGWLADAAIVVVEVAAREDFAPPPGFNVVDERRYGAARILILQRGER